MHVTMVKKRLRNGDFCKKCAQAEEVLRRRGLLDRVDRMVVAEESDPDCAGMRLARAHNVDTAPFFLVEDGPGEVRVFESVLTLIAQALAPAPGAAASPEEATWSPDTVGRVRDELVGQPPQEILGRVLDAFGARCALAFSGAEDVVLIDMAARSGRAFSVFCLDTGRLHPETYRFVDRVRKHYGVTVDMVFPSFAAVEDLVRRKGPFSFYDDGHHECCQIRKVDPLRRHLARFDAWVSGQRADQSPSTRADVPAVQIDPSFPGRDGHPLVKSNPLVRWTLADVWGYIRENGVPTNELHERGFVSIGCEPCTRAPRPGEHERAGRWWWEDATQRECGLHVAKRPGPSP